MKKLFCLVLIIALALSVAIGCESATDTSAYLRVHIRANDNTPEGQALKYAVKDQVTAFLTPYLAEATTKELAVKVVESRLSDIKAICDAVLEREGFSYRASVGLKREMFPTRSYGEFVLEAGWYDALVVELGEGKGDNWWCMVYPPLCFVGAEVEAGGKVVYKSKLLEIIEQFRQKYFKQEVGFEKAY